MLIVLKFYVEAKMIPQCSYNLTGSVFSWWDLKSSQFFPFLIPQLFVCLCVFVCIVWCLWCLFSL